MSNPAPNTSSFNTEGQRREVRPPRFDPIPIPYKELLQKLIEKQALLPLNVRPFQPPYPAWYNPAENCDYHSGNPGHSTENCFALKKRVQELRDMGKITLEPKSDAGTGGDPLPSHSGATVGCVEDACYIKRDVSEVVTPMEVVFQALLKVRWVQPIKGDAEPTGDDSERCVYHSGVMGHSIQKCREFRGLVQNLMDSSSVEFYVGNVESVNMINGQHEAKKSVVIYYDSTSVPQTESKPVEIFYDPTPVLNIEVPAPFHYKSDKAVPWSYNCQVTVDKETAEVSKDQGSVASASGSAEVDLMTRSGRCYSPKEVEKGKEIEKRTEIEKEAETGKKIKRPVSEEEAAEFMRFIKHSEFDIVEQLHRTPAKISLLSLILNSEVHGNALRKVLNEAYVPPDMSVDKMDNLVGNIMAPNFISFSEDEIPPDGRGSTAALHITAKCKEHNVAKVLIDNGSALNVMPISTLKQLPVDMSHMQKSQMIVRAFDGTCREVVGEIEIPIRVGPEEYNTQFQVMDICPSYTCLLGRPWIHMAGAVPSSLHQKIKFFIGDKLVSLRGEETLLVTQPSSMPYVEATEEALECSFRCFEFVNATYVAEGSLEPEPRLSKCTRMVIKQTVGKGCKVGFGLGKNLQGRTKLIKTKKNEDRFGLGYQPTKKDRMDSIRGKREARLARLKGEFPEGKKLTYLPLKTTFKSAGYVHPGDEPNKDSKMDPIQKMAVSFGDQLVLAIDEGAGGSSKIEDFYYVTKEAPDNELDNWTAVTVPRVFKNSIK